MKMDLERHLKQLFPSLPFQKAQEANRLHARTHPVESHYFTMNL